MRIAEINYPYTSNLWLPSIIIITLTNQAEQIAFTSFQFTQPSVQHKFSVVVFY